MKKTTQDLFSKYQTSHEIKRLCKRYKNDLAHLKNMPLLLFFDFVRLIPYQIDVAPVEVVARPKYLLQMPALDCKKKSILCGCYFELNGLKYRFIGSSNRPDQTIHHIFPQVCLNGVWKNFDATYNHYIFGQQKTLTNSVIL